ncbi:MAG TPA: UDP-N-acetylmuramoylalanyl-D-glutamyl-2,6-diaminopimelate--D-alanyl-D-alanine ligase [Beijerinckiaceae bacterium]|jgi:UDP-N-acetylmuramoyl-tripeptide--D-alanyl-D-alanine ligase
MNAAIWTGLALVVNLEARVSGPLPAGASGVSIDTRTLQPGDLFFAIKGDNSDGHDYVAAAFGKGAAAAVVDEAHADALIGKGPLFVVRDVLEAMIRLGRAARHRSPAWISAVTGSVGKTTTKEALRLALSRFGETHASAASYNNHWGVPLTLARMPETAHYGVFEIGMNHAGEITPLVDMVRPHVAIVTTIAPVHLEHLGSIEAIADAKAEIFTGLMPDGVAIIHRDVPQYEQLRRAAAPHAGEVLSFGAEEGADARLIDVRRHDAGSVVEAIVAGESLRYTLGAPGRHIAMNSLAVLLAARAMGCGVREAALALGDFMAPKGRGEKKTLQAADGTYLLLDESYNANPASMRAALDVLGATPVERGGRRIAVLGDMLELGPEAAELHRSLAPTAVANNVDVVYGAGPLTRELFDALPPAMQGAWEPTAAALAQMLPEAVRAGDVVMIKGSNGSRMGDVVAALQRASERVSSEVTPC